MAALRAGVPALVMVEAGGEVRAQSGAARRLLGPGVGRPCWDVVGALPGAEGLPCHPGCVDAMRRAGLDAVRETPLRVGGRPYVLTCVPVNGGGLCLLRSGGREDALPWQALTARELEVLRLLTEGATNAQVAAKLGIARTTARTHVENMRTKLGASTRAEVVALGFRLGYLD